MTPNSPNESEKPTRSRERPEDVESYKLAREEELRILDLQRSQLESMRTRATQYLAFGGAVTGFLVGAGLSNAQKDQVFFWLAGIATAVSFATVLLAVCVFVGGFDFRTRSAAKWQFALPNGFVLRAAEADIRPTESQINAYLARSYWQLADANQPALNRMQSQYVAFLAVGAMQLVLWVILVWARG